MMQRLLPRCALLLFASLLATVSSAVTVSSIRVMLHPYVAAPGQLPAAELAALNALTGVSLRLTGTTRTGGLEFALPQPLDSAVVAQMLRPLRQDRGVLWAEAIMPVVSAKAVAKSTASTDAQSQGQKLMVRLLGDPAVPDWTTLLPRWTAALGSTVTVVRRIGNVWVLTLANPVPASQLVFLAAQLENDAAIQYADPVLRAFARLVPNDTLYASQWALSNPVGGVNAPAAWDLQTGSSAVTVAVVDTGITQHPELAGRVLPGYDFISDPIAAGDGDGRDSNPADTGDWTDPGQCGDGAPGEDSSWHGTFVSGIIAANTNNGAGIAGMDWAAKILPVRVLGKCGGTFDDILDGMLWAAGVPVAGVPPNPNPARVINMSLGGEGGCAQSIQDAINTAMSQGAVIVVAAGNSSEDASGFTPAGCSGVITVGASTIVGDRASYSNFGSRLDISAPGGDFDGNSADLILSISNDGTTSPVNPAYANEAGTSAAAPHVAGTASLMLARNSTLTPGHVLDILTGSARGFPPGATCAAGLGCGSGLLDAGFALASTFPFNETAPPGTLPVVEYYRADRDHYFMTGDPAEIAFVDANYSSVFQRTGEIFYAWLDPALAPAGAVPVCRFYSPLPLIDSHFYTAIASECQFVIQNWPNVWLLENPAAFYVLLPDSTGTCPASTLPVYRFFDNRADANHRHTIDLTVRRAMINRAWVPEGTGPTSVAFCSPI